MSRLRERLERLEARHPAPSWVERMAQAIERLAPDDPRRARVDELLELARKRRDALTLRERPVEPRSTQ